MLLCCKCAEVCTSARVHRRAEACRSVHKHAEACRSVQKRAEAGRRVQLYRRGYICIVYHMAVDANIAKVGIFLV
jgi:hypothetical protein